MKIKKLHMIDLRKTTQEMDLKLNLGFISLSVVFLLLLPIFSFSQNLTGYQTNGSAVNYGNGLIRMTESGTNNEAGSAWNTTQHDLNEPFDLTVNIFFGCDNSPQGADGIAFQMHNDLNGTNAVGTPGGFLGMIQNSPSVAVEFDTWEFIGFGDLPEDHITILQNGNANNTAPNPYLAGPVPVSSGRDLEDCAQNASDYYTIRIVWTPGATQTIDVYEQGNATPSLSYTGDMITDIYGGNTMVWWGFTGSTGGGDNEQWIAPEGTIIPWQCETNSCCAPFEVSSTGEANICNGDTLDIEVTGSYSQYSWSTGETTSTIEITEPGTYTVDVLQDQLGTLCPGTDTIIVLPIGVTGTLTGDTTICNDGVATAPITVQFSGGIGPYTLEYSIDGVVQPAISGITTSPYIFTSAPGEAVYEVVSFIDETAGCSGFINNQVSISVYPDIPVGNDVNFCPDATVNLSVNDDGGTYDWFTAPTGGGSINLGASFTTPVLSSTTTYYVENTMVIDSIRKIASYTGASGGFDFYNDLLDRNTIFFTANTGFKIKSVDAIVNQWGATCGNIIVELRDITLGTATTITENVVCQGLGVNSYTINVNFDVISGHDYVMAYHSNGPHAPQMYDNFVAGYPINDFEEYTITGGGDNDFNNRWPGLFNWQIAYPFLGASCGRTPITAIASVVPDISVTDPNAVCEPNTVDITGTWVDNNVSGGTVSYHSDISATTANELTDPTAISVGGSYYVKIENETCTDIELITVTINPKPAVPVVVSPIEYCENVTASALTVTLLPSHTANWYTLPSGGIASATAPVPSTLVASTYYVSQETAAGCESDRVPIDIIINELPTATLGSDSIYCTEDLVTANILIEVTGGTGPYEVDYTYDMGANGTVNITGSTGTIQNTVGTDLGEGTYTLTEVRDDNGCIGTITGETSDITIYPDLVLSTDAICDLSTNTATVSATISGGVTAYQVTDETPGTGTLTGSSYSSSFLADGITAYSYTIFDATGNTPLEACANNSIVTSNNIDCSCELIGTLTASTNTTICPGESVTLNVTPSGSGDGLLANYTVILTDPDGLDVLATSVSSGNHDFMLTAPKQGLYTIKSIDDGNCVNVGSGSVTITILEDVTITTDLTGNPINLCPGDELSLDITASGTGDTNVTPVVLQYQWTHDGVDVGTNQNSYTNTVVDDGTDGGTYEVTVMGACGSETSTDVEVTVYEELSFTLDLSTTQLDLCPGDGINLNVVATGTGVQPPSGTGSIQYEWTTPNGVTSTTNTLDIPSSVTASTGNYSISAQGECDTIMSSVTPIVVGETTLITVEPGANMDLCPGEDFTLDVTAIGDNLTYQWQKDGVDTLTAGTTSSLTVTGVNVGDAASYRVIVLGDCGRDTSSVVTITIGTQTEITTEPVDANVCEFSNASFGVNAIGDALTYQWYKETAQLSGAINNSLSITSVTASDTGSYRVIVNGNCGADTSVFAKLNMTDAEIPSVSLDALPDIVCEGDSVVFEAQETAGGIAPTFLFRDANDITNVFRAESVNSTFTLNNLTTRLDVEVVMTSNSTCLAPGASSIVTDIVSVTMISPVQAEITNPLPLIPLDTQIVSLTFLNNIEVLDPGAGYEVSWSKLLTSQQGDISSPTSTITNLTDLLLVEPEVGDPLEGQGTTVLIVSVQDNGGICPATTDTITVIRKTSSTPVIDDVTLCFSEDLPFTLTGSTYDPLIETPSITDVNDALGLGNSFVSLTNEVIISAPVFTGNSADFNFIYEIQSPGFLAFDNAVVTIYAEPSIADAGDDIETCSPSVNLDAENPIIGIGEWTCDAGTLIDPSDANSLLSGLVDATPVTCVWTVSNGTCTESRDTVVVTKQGDISEPIIFLDGQNVTGQTIPLCENDVVALSSSIPVSPETGLWNIESGTSVSGISGSNTNQGNLNIVGLDTTVISWTIGSTTSGCNDETRELTLIVYPIPVANILTVSSLDTCEGTDISVTTEVVNANDEYTWINSVIPTGGPTSWTITNTDLSIGSNLITYEVKNAGCDAVTDFRVINVEADEVLNIGLNSFGLVCEGTDVTYYAVTSNDKSTLTYSWTYSEDPSITGSTSSDSLVLNNLTNSSGVVSVSITSSLRCTDVPFVSTSENLEVISGPNPIISTLDSIICIDNPTNLIATELGDPTNATYKWLLNGNTEVGNENELFYNNIITSGSYTIVADNGLCDPVTSNQIQISVSQIPNVNAYANGVNPITKDYREEIELDGQHSGASLLWTPSEDFIFTFDDPTITNPILTSSLPGEYFIRLTSFSGACFATDSVKLILTSPIKAPNVFTPNGDGDHDVFVIDGVGSYPNSSVSIYNRWGGLVYQANDYESNPWDGSDVPDGVYYFVVNLGPEQEKGEGHSGVIHVLR